jgi:hypothetical protein
LDSSEGKLVKRYYTAPELRKAGTLSATTAQQGPSNFKQPLPG